MKPGVIITGGARRVGAATALYFAKNGYDIALHYNRSEGDARKLVDDIEVLGANCSLFAHDLADTAGIAGLMKKIHHEMPNCTTLVNNASVFERSPLMDTTEALFDRQFDVNLKAPFFLTQAFAKNFGKGSVVNILDTDIVRTEASHFAYLLSKKALKDFTEMAARELGPNLTVNGVCPGSMLPSIDNLDGYEEKVATLVPMKSNPSLEELAEAIRWVSTQKHITGQILFVDGGKHVI